MPATFAMYVCASNSAEGQHRVEPSRSWEQLQPQVSKLCTLRAILQKMAMIASVLAGQGGNDQASKVSNTVQQLQSTDAQGEQGNSPVH